ncbi:MAG: glycosyltransferase family 4 protein [Vulcanimicrobiota bacterium]
MKVLIVHPRLDLYGGAELVVEKLARHLTTRGIENAVLTTTFKNQLHNAFEGIKVQICSRPPFLSGGIGEIVSLWKETRRLGKEYDLINVHNFPAELASFLLPSPVVWTCNEPPLVHLALHPRLDSPAELKKRLLLMLDRLAVRQSIRHVVAADEFNASRFRSLYGIEPRIIPYGIDYEFFSHGDGTGALKEFGLDGHFVILQTGTITPLKNQLESLKALVKIKDSIPTVKLVLAGQELDQYRKLLDSFIREQGIDEYVIFTGHVNRETVRNLYTGCHLLIHPVKSQGGWLTPFEALCAGLPVVVSKELTASSIIEREKIGQVTDNYAEAILHAYEHRQECRTAAKNGALWVRDYLSWEMFGDRMIHFFEEVLARKKGQPARKAK